MRLLESSSRFPDPGFLSALLRGSASLGPLTGAEPEDAVAALLADAEADDGAEFDRQCLEELRGFRADLLRREGRDFRLGLSRLHTLVMIVRRVLPKATVVDLRRDFIRWNSFFSLFTTDEALDLRREYWRILALSQEQAAAAGLEPRGLASHWLRVCAESGASYRASYLRVGLMGLRKLPLGADFSGNENFALQGLGRWAAATRPDKSTFLRQWSVLEGDYPHNPDFWPPRVERVVKGLENELFERTKSRGTSFPAAGWWRENVDIGETKRQRAAKPDDVAGPPLKLVKDLLAKIDEPFVKLSADLNRLIDAHRRYADLTGDVFYLVRTACNVGMQLLRRSPADERRMRGEKAIELAELSLNYDPSNVYAWALYRDGLRDAGRLADAELVGWEAVRRFPEDPQWRTQLADLIAENLGRPQEAAALLKDTIALFPDNEVARTQLATILAEKLQRLEEAADILKTSVRIFPTNAFVHTQLATILADDLGRGDEARAVLVDAIKTGVGNEATRTLLTKLDAERPLRGPRKAVGSVGDAAPASLDLPAAQARKLLFLREAGLETRDELAAFLEIAAPDPYLDYVGARAELRSSPLDTAFARAFDRAAREGSAPALRALLTQTSGYERFLVQTTIAVLEDRQPANGGSPGGMSHRLDDVIAQFVKPNGPERSARLTLLRDMAAANLSIAA
jgi:tetratricopeptide (TPR) repeat protein